MKLKKRLFICHTSEPKYIAVFDTSQHPGFINSSGTSDFVQICPILSYEKFIDDLGLSSHLHIYEY